MQKAFVHAIVLPLLLLVPPAIGQDDLQGEGRSAECVACHGVNGISENPMFPHLAGQNAAYLQAQLENFRDGTRYHPLMTPVAQSLSDEEISELANYFSSIGSFTGSRGMSRAGSAN